MGDRVQFCCERFARSHVCYQRLGHDGPHACGVPLDNGDPCPVTWVDVSHLQ